MKPRPVQPGDWTGNAVLGQVHRLHLTKEPPDEEPPVVEAPVVETPKPPARPRSRGLCNTLIGFAQYCPNTVQPGQAQCAQHLPKPKRTRDGQIGDLSVRGASSMVW